MSDNIKQNANYVYIDIPTEYIPVYTRLLCALADYGIDMLEDCKASCTDKDSGIIECFNMFNSAVAAYKLGQTKLAETLISYIDSTLSLKYKNITIPDSISFPVEEENAELFADFQDPPIFEARYGNPKPLESLDILGADEIDGVSSVYSIVYNPEDTTEQSIVWTVIEGQGNEYAYIDSTTGVLYLKSNANNNRVVIKATSASNPEIFATKEVYCTYNNENQEPNCRVNLTYNSDLVENGTRKTIRAEVVGTEKNISRLELYKIDSNNNNELIKFVENWSIYNFDITISGVNRFFVRAIFVDGTNKNSDIIQLEAVPCCYLGTGYNYSYVIDPYHKLSPMYDIASLNGKEYDFQVNIDGQWLVIVVPRIEGHMNIDEIRMDDTNLNSGFDMRYHKQYAVTEINGIIYDCYIVNFGETTASGPGFKQGNYRLLITG
jgi:hypothetical protein